MYPGDFGDPAEDCNCRCRVNQRARWALDDSELDRLKERAKYYELDKTENFEDYKQKYLKAVENSQEYDMIEYKNKIADVMGVDSSAVKLDRLPTNSLNSVLTATKQVTDKYPVLKKHLKGIDYDETLKAVASSSSIRGFCI